MSFKPLKVIQILPALESGGVERGTLELSDYLVLQGHQSWVISAGGRGVEPLENNGGIHIHVDIGAKHPRIFKSAFKLRTILKELKPDIVHLRSRVPAWANRFAFSLLKKNERPKLVSTVHGFYSPGRGSAIMTRGDAVIAVSKSIQRYIFQHYPKTDPKKVHLIYRGIDPQQFPYQYQADTLWKRQWYNQFPQLKTGLVLVLLGRLTRLKGHHTFIDLIDHLQQKKMPVHGLIVGGEDPRRRAYATEIKQRIKALQVPITCTGLRHDVREILSTANLLLSLSEKPESFGRSVLEALSLGVPVVGYNHGGVGELLQRLYPEGCVEVKNFQSLIQTTMPLLMNPKPVLPMQDFTLQDMLQKTTSLYHNLVNR
ncbi:glycosyltransferase [Magnetococcales bacterium HHB-1]